MSFYGNSFYYTAESFARIVLQNSGLNRYDINLMKGFSEVSPNEKKELDAPQRNSGLGIQSGNHWIKLATSGNTFQILHNGPGSTDPNKQTFQGCVVEDGEVDEDDQQKPVIMGWNQKITVPLISYDTAGHIIPTEEVTYLKMPVNPTSALEGRMQQIDGKNAEGKDEEPIGGSLKTELYKRVQQIDGKNIKGEAEEPIGGSFKTELYKRMQQIDGKDADGKDKEPTGGKSLKTELLERMEQIDSDDENSLKSKLDAAIQDFSNDKTKISSLWGYVTKEGWVDETGSQRQGLLQRVQTLEDQVAQLMGNKTETTE